MKNIIYEIERTIIILIVNTVLNDSCRVDIIIIGFIKVKSLL